MRPHTSIPFHTAHTSVPFRGMLWAILLLVASLSRLSAQGVDNLQAYIFSHGTDASQWITLTNPTTISDTYDDDAAYGVAPIGFTFGFCNVDYTQFSVNSNGCFSLGSTRCGTQYSSPLTSSNVSYNCPKIIGIGRDLSTGNNGYIRYQTVGNAPNRILVCEYKLAPTSSTSSSAGVNWQVQLHETDGKVLIVYNSTPSSMPSNFQIGLANSANDVITINPQSHSTAAGTSSTTYSTWPGQWHYYAFVPPAVECGYISQLNVSDIGSNSVSIHWTLRNPTTTTRVVLEYDDDPTFASPERDTIYSGEHFELTGLDASTTYYVRTSAICDEEPSGLYCTAQFTTTIAHPCENHNTIPIENGTNTSNYLWGYSYYGYSLTQQIYRQSEMGVADVLHGMAIEVGNSSQARQISIYLGHTAQNSVSSWIVPNDLTLVWSGTTQYTPNSWNEIAFTTPFQYNGTDNLLLVIEDHTGSGQSSNYNSTYVHSNGNYYSRYTYSSSATFSATTVPSSSGSSTNYRNNVRWYSCPNPCGVIRRLSVNSIGSNSAFITGMTNSFSATTQVILDYDDNPGFTSPQSVSVNGAPPYALTGLQPNTRYYVRAQITCGEGSGVYSNPTSFITLPQPCSQYGPQNTIPIGSGTSTNNFLWGYSYYENAFTEQIYRQSELGSTATLIGMAVEVGYANYSRQIKIYLGHTDQESVDSWILPDDLTLVWSGTTQYTANDWNNITFDTPFPYNGVDNLLLLIIDETGSYYYSPHNSVYVHSNSGYYSRYIYADNTDYDITSAPSSSGNTTNYRANVRWYSRACLSQSDCEVLAVSISNITDHTADVCWTGTNTTSYHLYFGAANETPTLVATLDSTAYTLTGMDADTRYTLYVLPDCATDFPAQGGRVDFHTDCGEAAGLCINYDDLSSCRVECRYGVFNNPDRNLGIVDYGSASSSSRHTVHTDPNETDPHTGGLLHTVPEGHTASVRLGNWQTGSEAESIRYRYRVDTTISDLLILKYAAVLEDPNHTASEQPRFTFRVTDEQGNDLNADCYSADFIANSSLGWNTYGSTLWKDWTTVGVSLNEFHGQTIYIKLTTYDCDQSGHFGYAYFVIDCGNKRISSSACGDVVENTYTAPAGFVYRWYSDDAPNTILATTQSYHTTQAGVYHCELSFVGASNNSCSSVLTAISGSRYPFSRFDFSYEDTTDCSVQVRFSNSSVISSDLAHTQLTNLPCEQYLWRFGDGTTSTLTNPLHTFTEGNHTVTLLAMLSNGDCIDSASVNIQISGLCHNLSSTEERTICDNQLPYTWNDTTFYQAGEKSVTLTSANGFDSIVTMILHVNPTYADTVTASICDGGRYPFEGSNYTAAGTYDRHLTTQHNCDSLRTLVLEIRSTSNIVDTRNVCDSLTWHGTTYRTSTLSPTYHSTNADGCDSTVTLHLTVRHSNSGIDEQNVCDSLIWHGTTYSTSTQLPTYQSTNVAGCDSVTTLHLTIRHSNSGTDERNVCDSLTWHGITYRTSTQTPTYHSMNADGCDSTTTLILTVRHSSRSTETYSECDSMTWHGTTYHNSTQAPSYHLTNAEGCDSTVMLHLTIYHSSHTTTQITSCEHYIWHDSIYEDDGTYRHNYSDANGCASSETLVLHIVHGTHRTYNVTECVHYSWHGTDYTASGTYRYNYNNADGCASTDTLHLTILEASHNDTAAEACEHYRWNRDGITYSESGIYVYEYQNEVGCLSHDTLHLTIHEAYSIHLNDTICQGEQRPFDGAFYNVSGDYSAQLQSHYGCDSTVTLHLLVRPQPQVSIFSEYSCSHETYWLTAVSDGDHFTWHASAGEHQLEGHNHDIVVKLRPREVTTVTLTADYSSGRSCPNETVTTLVPITNVVAEISCRPEVLRPENRQVEAKDMSSGHTARQWYVDGVAWGNEPVINCEADEEAEEMVITLVAYNDLCSDTAEKHLYPTDETLFVPNVFTPSLSTNSTFRAHGTGILEYHITIYTREGQMVFSGDSLDSEWDGTHDGEPCPQGNYVYQIRYRGRSTPDGWQLQAGSILLLR